MSLRCRFGWHEWDRWKFTKTRDLRGGFFIGYGTGQYRSCRKCGGEQVR